MHIYIHLFSSILAPSWTGKHGSVYFVSAIRRPEKGGPWKLLKNVFCIDSAILHVFWLQTLCQKAPEDPEKKEICHFCIDLQCIQTFPDRQFPTFFTISGPFFEGVERPFNVFGSCSTSSCIASCLLAPNSVPKSTRRPIEKNDMI